MVLLSYLFLIGFSPSDDILHINRYQIRKKNYLSWNGIYGKFIMVWSIDECLIKRVLRRIFALIWQHLWPGYQNFVHEVCLLLVYFSVAFEPGYQFDPRFSIFNFFLLEDLVHLRFSLSQSFCLFATVKRAHFYSKSAIRQNMVVGLLLSGCKITWRHDFKSKFEENFSIFQ